jgi:EpsI family protein
MGLWRYIAVIGMLGATAIHSRVSEYRPADHIDQPLESISRSLAGWSYSHDAPLDARSIDRLKATAHLSRVYTKNGRKLALFIAFYSQQRAGETMHSPKHCLPGTGWAIWRQSSIGVHVGNRKYDVNHISVHNSADRATVLYWYQSRRNLIVNEYVAKAVLLRDALLNGHTASSLVRITISDEPGSVDQASEFAAALIPELQRCLGT